MMKPLQKIQSYLGDHPWRNTIQYFDVIDSTNTLAKQLAAQGAPDGTVLIADRQSAGRGRMGRSFFSPGGMGIYISVLLRPNCMASEIMHLTCATAVAACDAVESAFGFRPGVKWTNDLIWNEQKLGGILTELSLNPKTFQVESAIVGIGINCCQSKADFDPSIRPMACSAQMITEAPVDRELLTSELIKALYVMDAGLLTEKESTLNRYRQDCFTLGKEISIVRGEDIRHATAMDIDEQGALIVKYEDGTIEPVNSGEVSIRGLYGYV